jgi:hypothetical protein
MNVDIKRVREYLSSFDFQKLFIEELNWNSCTLRPIECPVGNECYKLSAIAELGGLVVYLVEPPKGGEIPPINERRKIEQQAKKATHEHLLIFVDGEKTQSTWQWVRRSIGVQTANREFPYNRGQHGDLLLQKLNGIAFNIDEFDKDGNVAIIKVLERVSTSFDVEKVTKKFYDEFKNEHDYFCEFLKGIDNQDEMRWYTSVMLNRIMFIYFIQKKGFLDGDQDYLKHKLDSTKKHGANQFYSSFLTRLFFEGFAKEEKTRSAEINALLGKVPYLNGGLFLPHQLEVTYGKTITINDAVFERLFAFFDRYDWHLDYRPLRSEKEINPDVLGYIFEKYINQKQMGAYYTKEDITDYICKNTIIPFLFDKLENSRYNELHPFPMNDVEPYIYDAVKQAEYLPTETESEYQARRKRYEQILDDFTAGKIAKINDLVTYNLNIRQFAEDWVSEIKDPVTLHAFYYECLKKITVLDPTVGSGAFLFAALNILEPLYEICLDKMQKLNSEKFPDFATELDKINQHPNRAYFILKSIIVNNLFGVDIMEEAVEICKLRLFLKLVAQVDSVDKIEPLPDIDFNIRAGNTLVGYATLEEIQKAQHLDLSGARKEIEQKIINADIKLDAFRKYQTNINISASEITKAKAAVISCLKEIEEELNKDLAALYGARNVQLFIQTHQPFHWFVEFYGIMKKGGFDVVVGNPPYVEYVDIKRQYTLLNYETEHCGNLYAFITERSLKLLYANGRFGMIVPVSGFCTDRMENYQSIQLKNSGTFWISHYAERPSKLFTGAERNLSIPIIHLNKASKKGNEIFSTTYIKWNSEFRDYLFQNISYTNVTTTKIFGIIPKIGSQVEVELLKKLGNVKKTIGSYTRTNQSPHILYYRNSGGRYWKIVTDFQPNFYLNGEKSISSRETYLFFDSKKALQISIAALNSSLYYWFYVLHSDARTNNPSDLKSFPIDIESLSQDVQVHLCSLSTSLMNDIRGNAILKDGKYRTGRVKFQEFYPLKSKSIINEIDRVLAKHYNFTEEELNFIINYDIKYRMGKDDEE